MRKTIILTATALLLISTSVLADLWNNSAKEISFPPHAVYMPVGFDTNDNSQVIIEGTYPNTCYQSSRTIYDVDHEKKEINVENHVLVSENAVCLQIVVPYKKVISLGLLQKGRYSVNFKVDLKHGSHYVPMGDLGVTKATKERRDDYLYAPVKRATFSHKTNTLTLKGTYIDSEEGCMNIDEVKVMKPVTSKNVINVLPIMDIDKKCSRRNKTRHFSVDVKIPKQFKGRHLLHIRVLDGSSLNEIVNIGM